MNKEYSIKYQTFKEVQRFLDRIEHRKDIKKVMFHDCGNYILLTYNKTETEK